MKQSSIHYKTQLVTTMEVKNFQINIYVNISFLKLKLLNFSTYIASYSTQQ